MNPSEKMPEEILRRIYGVHFSAQSEEALQKRLRTQQLVQQLNLSFPEEYEKREKIFQNLFGHFGKDAHLEPPFHCDCGENIFIGDKTFLNFNVTILDSAEVRIGNNCWIAPNVQIYAATHPTDYLERRKICLAKPITIGNDVWIGGGSIILPGVQIGDGAVIGAGSVVTHDIPAFCIAFGNPCKVHRYLKSEEDRTKDAESLSS